MAARLHRSRPLRVGPQGRLPVDDLDVGSRPPADQERFAQHGPVDARHADAAAIDLAAFDLHEGLITPAPGNQCRKSRLGGNDGKRLPVVAVVDFEPDREIDERARFRQIESVDRARGDTVYPEYLGGERSGPAMRAAAAEEIAYVLGTVGLSP